MTSHPTIILFGLQTSISVINVYVQFSYAKLEQYMYRLLITPASYCLSSSTFSPLAGSCCSSPDLPLADNERFVNSVTCPQTGEVHVSYDCIFAHKPSIENGVILMICKDGKWEIPDGVCEFGQ